MTARDTFLQRLGAALMDRENPAALTEVLDEYDQARRAELAEEFAAALLADSPLRPHGSATYYAERHAALVRRMAAPTTTQET